MKYLNFIFAFYMIFILTAFNGKAYGQITRYFDPCEKIDANIIITKHNIIPEINNNEYNKDTLESATNLPDIDLWYEVGGGLDFSSDVNDPMYIQYHSIALNYDKKYLLSMRYTVQYNKIDEIGGLYHFHSTRRFGTISAGAGIGVICGVHDKDTFTTVGLPIELKAFFTPVRYFGIGLGFITNINPEIIRTYVNFNIRLGKLF
jgi:hypothetical protein